MDPGVGRAEGFGRVGVVEPGAAEVFFGCLEPLSPVGLGRGRFEFCVLPHSRFLTTRGSELTSLASMARARVTRSVSSLTGMIE